eukprot:6211219-Pleurochrysis_carterae.AAC.2
MSGGADSEAEQAVGDTRSTHSGIAAAPGEALSSAAAHGPACNEEPTACETTGGGGATFRCMPGEEKAGVDSSCSTSDKEAKGQLITRDGDMGTENKQTGERQCKQDGRIENAGGGPADGRTGSSADCGDRLSISSVTRGSDDGAASAAVLLSLSEARAQQNGVHGLLGQRLFAPRPADAVRAANRAAMRRVKHGAVEPLQPSQAAAALASGPGAYSESEATEAEQDGQILLRLVSAGQSEQSIPIETAKFGVQGEGALEGTHRHYVVAALHRHDYRYSLFNCTLGAALKGRQDSIDVKDKQPSTEGIPWSVRHRPTNRL